MLNPTNIGKLEKDHRLKINNIDQLTTFKQVLVSIKRSNITKSMQSYTLPLWIEEFTEYMEKGSCNVNINNFALDYCIKKFARFVPIFSFPDDYSMSVRDGPLISKDQEFIGYFLSIPSKTKLSFVYSDIKRVMSDIDYIKNNMIDSSHPAIVTPTSYISKMASLMKVLLQNMTISVLISVIVSMVVIFVITWDVSLAKITILAISLAVVITISIVLWLGECKLNS